MTCIIKEGTAVGFEEYGLVHGDTYARASTKFSGVCKSTDPWLLPADTVVIPGEFL